MSAEKLFLRLIVTGHIILYQNNNTIATESMERIRSLWPTKVVELGLADWMSQGICQELSKNKNNGAHVRLNTQFGWEVYIRDHFGAPNNIPGVIPGSLQASIPASTTRTMPIPLHVCLAETLARIDARGVNEGPWGKNQTQIRRAIADAAVEFSEGGVSNKIPLDKYYHIFSTNGASHMADTMMQRSRSDSAAAKFELAEIENSEPRKWNIILEPSFIRWRAIQREREVTR